MTIAFTKSGSPAASSRAPLPSSDFLAATGLGICFEQLEKRYGALLALRSGSAHDHTQAVKECGNSSFHLITPMLFPTRVKASIALSSCCLSCAALSWTRIRALPLGTTGKKNPIA